MRSDPVERDHAVPHARERVESWGDAWRRTGRFVLLLDFDGTLAPIVPRPELAELPARTRAALSRLLASPGLDAAVVSGRGLADARERAGLPRVWYAGNHGMEIEGPELERIHPDAAAARPDLERARDGIGARIRDVEGAFVEDKGLTLSVHYRLAARDRVPSVRAAVHDVAARLPALRVTEGKEVLEVRPRVDWHKGRAVEFLLEQLRPAPGVPVVYIGDDTTDEDAFRVLRETESGEGVVVADPPPPTTAARSRVRDPDEVAELLERLADLAPGRAGTP